MGKMKLVNLSRDVFVAWAIAAMLAGCGVLPFDSAQGRLAQDDTPPIPYLSQVTAESARAPVAYDVLYSFPGAPNGAYPTDALVDLNGKLYGTAGFGGEHGDGVVFSITKSGKETVVYSFKGSPSDGTDPSAPLIDVNGTLYGSTSYGGRYGGGTVFAITTSGEETVLYNFKGRPTDGANPSGALLNVDGTFYGTTLSGGSHSCRGGGCGTVFSITTSGKEAVLHSFKGANTDGQNPTGGLVNVDGKLYGTTNLGGAHGRKLGCGTVFSIATSGNEAIVHSFKCAPSDGQNPDAGVIYVDGKLYGTTSGGGQCSSDPSGGCGTVFASTLSGAETVLYSFKGADGAAPQAALLDMKGTLYGTTIYGGSGSGGGTLFAISTSGKERVLHNFDSSAADGSLPTASLINVNGTLYGTTDYGGTSDHCESTLYPGCGTVFALTP
jgi:uncharacterized repeat protein (TIGR03803 family)